MRKEFNTSSTTKSILIHAQPSATLFAIYLHNTPSYQYCRKWRKWAGWIMWGYGDENEGQALLRCLEAGHSSVAVVIDARETGEEYKCEQNDKMIWREKLNRQKTQQIETKVQTCAFVWAWREAPMQLKDNRHCLCHGRDTQLGSERCGPSGEVTFDMCAHISSTPQWRVSVQRGQEEDRLQTWQLLLFCLSLISFEWNLKSY